jgi:hypothetical protein
MLYLFADDTTAKYYDSYRLQSVRKQLQRRLYVFKMSASRLKQSAAAKL